ncbi:hypothetical protein M2212_007101 [Bradyrhizobium elkanii]|jgi:hypothetical protein|nr:hypothetical protein [Bradyrhizobium elkanii]
MTIALVVLGTAALMVVLFMAAATALIAKVNSFGDPG